jgi:hypothetical protein
VLLLTPTVRVVPRRALARRGRAALLLDATASQRRAAAPLAGTPLHLLPARRCTSRRRRPATRPRPELLAEDAPLKDPIAFFSIYSDPIAFFLSMYRDPIAFIFLYMDPIVLHFYMQGSLCKF